MWATCRARPLKKRCPLKESFLCTNISIRLRYFVIFFHSIAIKETALTSPAGYLKVLPVKNVTHQRLKCPCNIIVVFLFPPIWTNWFTTIHFPAFSNSCSNEPIYTTSLPLRDPLPLQRLGNVGANSLRCEFYLFWNCFVPLFWCRTAQLPSTQLLCWAALALLGLPPFSFRSVASAWTNSFLCGRLSLSAGRIWHRWRRTVQLSHAIRMQDEAACNKLLKQCSTVRAAAMLTKWRPQAAKPTNAFLAAAWQKLTDVSGVSDIALSLCHTVMLLAYTFSRCWLWGAHCTLHPVSLALFCLLKAAKCFHCPV